MAADLHLHVFKEGELTEADFQSFFSRTIGSKWFGGWGKQDDYDSPQSKASREAISNTPNLWIGEVSWLKAGLFDDPDQFIPDVVQSVSDTIGEELPIVDDQLIEKLRKDFTAGNRTDYEVSRFSEAEQFLRSHMGCRAFTVSW